MCLLFCFTLQTHSFYTDLIIIIYFYESIVLHKDYKQNALNACPPKKEEGQHQIIQDY